MRLPSVFSDYGISGKNSGIDGHISLAYLPTPKRRVPCGQSVISQLGIDAVVAVAVNKTACDPCDPGIGVNVAQGIQCALAVVGRKGAAVITLFPKMPGPL